MKILMIIKKGVKQEKPKLIKTIILLLESIKYIYSTSLMIKIFKKIENEEFMINLWYIITILNLYYIFCFNTIYPHMKDEWI